MDSPSFTKVCTTHSFNTSDSRLAHISPSAIAFCPVTKPLSLDKEQLGRLKTAQRAWITFRDAQCRYEAGVYEGGSIDPLVHSSCLTKLTEQRTKDLIAQLDQP
ncbi:lysozyme inhibitor LprI family protein [Aeromonas hydrophila]|uniref:lysozyme inhibitor LprI family protein n=1 Tax=Aeromonas hydrophila TaxID=644 RepID=UPI0029D5C951|nr:lysozyme inhibitor LprI family protein [Aeromonas hydrophila]MDX7780227.1 lysozyme inhibitor LprI family protein [Aeromonas hydrophila]